MIKRDLLKLIEELDDDAVITVVNPEQDCTWDIEEVRVCEDNTSEYKNRYADLVIRIEGI